MPGPDIRALAENVRTLGGAALTANYQDVGTVTLNPVRIVSVKNTTDVTVEISWDAGTTTVFRLPPSSVDTIDLTTNDKGCSQGGGIYLKVGSLFQARHIGVGTQTGEIIIQCFYA